MGQDYAFCSPVELPGGFPGHGLPVSVVHVLGHLGEGAPEAVDVDEFCELGDVVEDLLWLGDPGDPACPVVHPASYGSSCGDQGDLGLPGVEPELKEVLGDPSELVLLFLPDWPGGLVV